ncbi:uncharacterized protein SOCE26_069650 [Sorangium cellulosum]|uniref:Uncharacterized protein n=1 Tax=Sorangium cellulosum TaxID=56 RepID=A0A2L0F1N1_SORCE|nr:hypothetical protein [Sorangium cellulosum]AUX45474.1 uncharacterized protein SOCE26_069650 [Sorangium cellulosum]
MAADTVLAGGEIEAALQVEDLQHEPLRQQVFWEARSGPIEEVLVGARAADRDQKHP